MDLEQLGGWNERWTLWRFQRALARQRAARAAHVSGSAHPDSEGGGELSDLRGQLTSIASQKRRLAGDIAALRTETDAPAHDLSAPNKGHRRARRR